MTFLCIDIGGTNTLIGMGNGDFEVVKKVKSRDFLDDIGRCLEETFSRDKIESIDQVAVAAAGPIDREKGVFYPPNIHDMESVQIEKPLQELGELKIINDCTSAVLGEYHYGGHCVEHLLYVTISSGIGAGMVVDGDVVEGWNGNFGEVGHMEIAEEGVECGCGGEDHWEAYCSGNSLPRLAKLTSGKEFEDARELFQENGNGDRNAEETIRRMQELNANAFANLINLYNPEKIVLGGAVPLNHPEAVVEPLEEQVEEQSINEVPSIEVCSLEEEAVLHGLRAVCNGKHR
ncbi:MAG: ROK family protein [Candidatus Nanohaloarchaea archaeon]